MTCRISTDAPPGRQRPPTPRSPRILITGSDGLVGSALRANLEARGADVVGLDLRARVMERGDIRDASRVRAALADCDGVVHLAAVSRVVWAQQDPRGCWQTNVEALRNLLATALARPRPPWVLFASSREVYGQAAIVPVAEDARPAPVNVYGRSKLAGERLVLEAQRDGLRAAVVRLSNVYGSTRDHADRVVPAFARAAVTGAPLRVDGADQTFDFTHIDDTTRGLVALIERLARG